MKLRPLVLFAATVILGIPGLPALPAQAATNTCKITGYSPHSVTSGLSPKSVKFGITTTGSCDNEDWSVDLDGPIYGFAWDFDPYITVDPSDWSSASQHANVKVTTYDVSGREVFLNVKSGFTIKRYTYWQGGTFNASPEPVTKGKKITIKGRLLVADWYNARYVGAGIHTVSVQFKAFGAKSYATVKTVTTDKSGWLNTTVTASKTGAWRAVYGGTSLLGSATSAGDTVAVR